MSIENDEPVVKDVERIEIAPAGDDADNVDETENDTQSDSTSEEKNADESAEETPEIEPEADSAEEPTKKDPITPAPATVKNAPQVNKNSQERLPGETPREYALRLEVTRLRNLGKSERREQIMTPTPPVLVKKELSPEKKKVLEQYKPEDVVKLKEVFDVLAEDMGFVRGDQLNATTFQEKASEVLDDFMDNHPEYMPENDPGNVLWERFKKEYNLYKPPSHPKDVKKLLEKVHREVFGIKPTADLKIDNAATEKIKVASHSGSPRPAPSREGVKRSTNAAPQGLRVDMLKGFSEEEKAELLGE